VSVVPDAAVYEFLDDNISGHARFSVGKRVDKTDGVDADGLFDGTDWTFVRVFGGDHPLGNSDIHLKGIVLAMMCSWSSGST
jgi:hypothetical protein